MQTLYKQLGNAGAPIKVLYGPHNTFLEIYSNGEMQGWKRLLSGYYIKLSRDWVPEEVIHQQLSPPLQVQALEEELVAVHIQALPVGKRHYVAEEQLVQRWYECIVGKEPSEKKTVSSSTQNDSSQQQSRGQQHRQLHQPSFQKRSV